MAKVGINTGSAANAGDGSALRAGANIINANFDEIYEYFGDGTTLDADLAGKWLAVATGINTLSNIGIGTTNPWNALTVLGNASITGVTTSSGGFSGDITGTVTGNVYNTGISTFQDVLVSGASTVTGKSTFTGIGTFSSDLYVGGNLYTLGDVTYDEVNGRNISVTGIGTIAYLGVTDLNVSGFSTFSGLSTTGSDLYIGDSLYVSQDATVTGVLTANAFKLTTGAGISTDNINTNNIKVSGITTLGTVTTVVGSAVTFNASGGTIVGVLTATTARVGVITSTAAVAGDDFIIEGDSDRGMSIISGSESSANIYFGDSSDTDVGRIVYQHNDNALDFHTNGSATNALRISSTGNIGINSQSPSVKLDVGGGAAFSEGLTVTGVSTFNNDFVAAGTTANLSWDKSEDYLQFGDNVQAVFGNSADLVIKHDGADSRITQSSGSVGNLMITNSRADEEGGIYLQGKTGEQGIIVYPNSHVNLYFNNSLKLSTSGIGVTITGGITCTGAGSTYTFEGDIKMTGNNNFFNPPSLTNTERNNATTMTAGSIIWNETQSRLEYYNGSAWKQIDRSAV